MRRLRFASFLAGFSVLVVFVSVSWTKDDPMAANKDLVRRVYEDVVNKGSFDVVDAVVDPGYVYHTDPSMGGPAGVKQLIGKYRAAFPDLALVVEDLVAEGDRVAVRWSATGTNKGEIMGMKATGKSVAISGMAFYRIKGGKIAEGWEIMEDLGMMQQLGVVPMIGETAK